MDSYQDLSESSIQTHRSPPQVLEKRASDLLSPWVGETEQRIADAFAEARDAEAFLIFDEADSLLADRRSAHRSWCRPAAGEAQ